MLANIKFYLLCGAIAAVLIGDLYIAIHFYNRGWNAAVAAIAAKDRKALDAVNKATESVDDCYRSGRVWNTVDGVCASE